MEKLEIVARDENADRIVEIIHQHGKTGRRGDGLVYVTPVLNAYRIRDFKQGNEILKPQKLES